MAEKVTVVGTGLIGRAWAIAFARGGKQVALYDQKPEAAVAALDFISTVAADLAEGDLLNGLTPAELLARIEPVADLSEALADTTHVQESTFERLDVKIPLFAELDALTAPGVPLASSTSGLLPSSFTKDLPGQARCLVAHPINPPYLVPAVELVPAPWSEPAVVERVAALMRDIGQVPLKVNREIDGFIMNRLQGALLHEAFRLVAEGYASMEDVDAGIRDGLGLRWAFMGPFETIDLNAPLGITDYVDRLGGMYGEMAKSQHHVVDWKAPAAAMERELEPVRPRSELKQRQIWRDRRLMALIRHKRQSSELIGD